MSMSFNVFVSQSRDISEIVACVEDLIEHQLRPTDRFGRTEYEGHMLGIFVGIMPASEFIDYGDMDFTSYSARVILETSDGGEIQKRRVELARSLALLCAAVLSFDRGFDCMVVEGLDELIEKFPGKR
jgi:hypothetical protein